MTSPASLSPQSVIVLRRLRDSGWSVLGRDIPQVQRRVGSLLEQRKLVEWRSPPPSAFDGTRKSYSLHLLDAGAEALREWERGQ